MALLKRRRWLHGTEVCEMIGLRDTEKTKAKDILSKHAERWGIKKIKLGPERTAGVRYQEEDVIRFMDMKEKDAAERLSFSQQ
jgi:hypothetical protein